MDELKGCGGRRGYREALLGGRRVDHGYSLVVRAWWRLDHGQATDVRARSTLFPGRTTTRKETVR
jgi:hypothetical protein